MNERRCPYNYSIKELQETTWRLSREIIRMTTQAGSGHPSSSLSAMDVMTVLYFGGVMCFDPRDPNFPERDRFILSKGHGAPALYAVLAESGFFDKSLLSNLREFNSPLEGHPNMLTLPGVEASTGSLGQGLSIGIGHALAAKVDGLGYRVFVMIGDGESDEGQIWEAAMAAVKYKLDNLTVILDYNRYQQTGSIQDVMPSLEPIVDKWQAFGWDVREINGHYIKEILLAFNDSCRVTVQPQMIIAHTLKGKGLSPFSSDDVNRMHGKPLSAEEAKIALAELDEQKFTNMYSEPDITLQVTPKDKHGEL